MRTVLGLALMSVLLDVSAAGNTLVCQGRLSGSNRPDVAQSTVEFTLDYAEGMQVATLKSNFEALNGPLAFQLDDPFLRARHELRVSRNTGQFSLAVALYRDIDFPDGGALWEGACQPREVVGRKF